jgi:hypothetical protein
MINRLEKIKEAPDFAIFSIKWLERIFLCGAILISIYTWLKSVDFTPDSTNYIVAGKNLLQFHQFFVYTHWPSHSLDLMIEPFTDFPPGFSILFAGFLFLAKDLYLAIIASQIVYIVLFFASFAYFFHVIKIKKNIRIVFWMLIPLFPPFIGIFQFYLSEIVFIAITLFIGSLCLSPNFKFRFTSTRLWIILALIFVSSSIKFIGVLNCLWVFIPLFLANIPRKSKLLFIPLVMIASITAPLLWFMRNHIQYGLATKSHAIGSIFLPENILAPFHYLFYTPYGLMGIFLAAVFFIGLVLCIKKFPLYLRLEQISIEQRNSSLTTYKTLVVLLIVNFLFLLIVSLFAHINALDGRLLSPSFSIALVLIAFILSHLWSINKRFFWITLFLFISLVLINNNMKLSPELIKKRSLLSSIKEKALEEIFYHPHFAQSSGFFTEYNFNYQLYANLPHRMLWDTKEIATPDRIQALFNKGNQVFFIFKEGSKHDSVFKAQSTTLPLICEKHFSGYTLFFQRNECTTPLDH